MNITFNGKTRKVSDLAGMMLTLLILVGIIAVGCWAIWLLSQVVLAVSHYSGLSGVLSAVLLIVLFGTFTVNSKEYGLLPRGPRIIGSYALLMLTVYYAYFEEHFTVANMMLFLAPIGVRLLFKVRRFFKKQ